jgi:hypothetical protein
MKNGHECIMLCFTNREKPIGCNHFPEISNNICVRKGLGTLSVNILYLQMVDAKGSEGSKKYTCENCNYHTSRLSQFNRHLLTAKHKMFTNVDANVDDRTQKSSKAYVCGCGKAYTYRQSLYVHKKKCNYTPPALENSVVDPKEIPHLPTDPIAWGDMKELVMLLATTQATNQENNTKLLATELVKALPPMGGTHTNSHNNNNTLNFYLTQTCKNAESIHDFTDRFVERSSEFFNNNYRSIAEDQTNFASGIMDIFWKCMEEKPQIEKFIQTTDVKNGVLYVKEKKKNEQRQLCGEAEFVKYMDGFEKAGLNIGHEMNKVIFPMKMKFVETLTAECGSPPHEEDFDDEDEYENALHKFKERVGDMKQRLSRQTYNATTLFDKKPQREGILIKTKRMKEHGA